MSIFCKSSDESSISFMYFRKKKQAAKTGKLLKRQQPVVTKATVGIIATFIFNILSKMFNNVNHSKHFRNTIPMFWEIVENV